MSVDDELIDMNGLRSLLDRTIRGALINAINDHGPITRDNFSSASKRVVGALKEYNKQVAAMREKREKEKASLCLL